MEKDYSLLRPFDLDAAKRGDKLFWASGDGYSGRYLAGPNGSGDVAFEDSEGDLYVSEASEFFMAPLCWVEGRPVYKGDVLYKQDGSKFIARTMYSDTCILSDQPFIGSSLEKTTWSPPKVKREGWVNVYGIGYMTHLYEIKKEADENASDKRKACIRIEWEE